MSSRLRLSSSARLAQSWPGKLMSGVWEDAKPATILAISPLLNRFECIRIRFGGSRGDPAYVLNRRRKLSAPTTLWQETSRARLSRDWFLTQYVLQFVDLDHVVAEDPALLG